MSKHNPPSLLERAAELYDFGAVLRPPAAPVATAPVAAAPEVEPASEPEILELEPFVAPAPVPAPAPDPEPEPTVPQPGGVAVIDVAALAEKGFIVPGAPVTGLAEEFRLVKHQLLAGIDRYVSLPAEKRRAVLITSGQPGEGKTFTAVNLALSLAGERDLEVLLIDGDVVKPDALATLGVAGGGPGLVDALADPAADPEAFVLRTDVPGLSVLPSGRKTNDVPELLASERTRELLARLVAADPRRIVLFDTPPALLASFATVLAGHVGQALVVVRADRTTEADLRETVGLLDACGHVGLLLNGAAIAVNGRRFGAYDGYGDGD